jgi:hypothetical protein
MASRKTPDAKRRLLPAFRFKSIVFVWACSDCRRLFFGAFDDYPSKDISRHILHEFACHFCAQPQRAHAPGGDSEVIEISSWPTVEPGGNPAL